MKSLLQADPQASAFIQKLYAHGVSCQTTGNDIKFTHGMARIFCPSHCEHSPSGLALGSTLHPMRSSLCQAAMNDGVIPPSGGEVVITRAPGVPSYGAVDFNGVASQAVTDEKDDAFHSYAVEHSQMPKEVPQMGEIGCDTSLDAITHFKNSAAGSTFLVECRSECVTAGPLFGTSVYSPNSSICRAAEHAGVIGSEGGNIVVTIGHPQDFFLGSQHGDFHSDDAPGADRSFVVAKPTAEVLMRSARVPDALRRFL